jgi:hypothetical protein
VTPANVYIRLLGDAGWTKGIAYPLFVKPQASIGDCSQAQKERTFCLRQTRSEIEGMQRADGRSTEASHGFRECGGKAPVERIRARNIRMAGLKAKHEFLKRDTVCVGDAEHPGGKEFVYEGPGSERQLRWRRCSLHCAETRRLRRSTIETKEPVSCAIYCSNRTHSALFDCKTLSSRNVTTLKILIGSSSASTSVIRSKRDVRPRPRSEHFLYYRK